MKYMTAFIAAFGTIWLALANRQNVIFSLDPFSNDFPFIAFEIPVFILVMASFALGILVGGVWIRIIIWRKTRKSHNKKQAVSI